jgi:hypothetical protein
MQSSHPRFVNFSQVITDPETGKVYGREQPIPYKVAARLGLVPATEDDSSDTERSAEQGPNTARKPRLNRMRRKGGDR